MQQVHGPEATTVPPLVLVHLPWSSHTDEAMSASSRMAQEVVGEATSESSRDCSGKRRRKETGGALTWRVMSGEAGGKRSVVRHQRRLRGTQRRDGPQVRSRKGYKRRRGKDEGR